jgi:DNA modification methylase
VTGLADSNPDYRPFIADRDFTLHLGDVREILPTLGAGSVDCVVTSPPYWGLRDYNAAGQIGLEATPDLYVAEMVQVFRQVRRVLAPHGTVWLNLGDSYAQGPSGTRTWEGGQQGGETAWRMERPWSTVGNGLRPKDLVGIPWRVAFALQQPYYAGTIANELDRIWLAAMIDAEGCIYIHCRKVGQSNGQGYERKNNTYGSGLEISNTSREVVERAVAIVGRGSISESTRGRNQLLYRWNLRTNECRDVLREVYPHLVAKQHQARLAIGCPSSGREAEAAHGSLMALHNGDTATIDFPAPESMFEPGWYLRSDVIWSKSNPMPESVTDRPTKSHEYVFLLTKGPRYFFDQEAVREPHVRLWDPVTNGGSWAHTDRQPNGSKAGHHSGAYPEPNPSGRNVRSVWEIATQPYPEAHFATFPEALPERCIKAGCPEQVCQVCGKPRERIVETTYVPHGASAKSGGDFSGKDRTSGDLEHGKFRPQEMKHGRATRVDTTAGWSDCNHGSYRPGVVLDPFMGSGTVALVARRLGRRSIGVELSPEYAELAARRLQQLSLLAEASA